jgi:secondary thiamine-phosphate synthase enzyme
MSEWKKGTERTEPFSEQESISYPAPWNLRKKSKKAPSPFREDTVLLNSKTASNGIVEARPGIHDGSGIYSRIVDYTTEKKFQLINLTDRVNAIVAESGVEQGILHVQSLHTTTAVFLNEWQEALLHDMQTMLEQIVGQGGSWRHDDPALSDCERKNAASHLRSLLLGQSLSLQVRNGRVLLGTWQSIILAELDGPRTRSLSVQVMGM